MSEAGGGRWNDLSQRLISGGIVAAIGLWAMWAGGFIFHLLIGVVAGIVVWELLRMLNFREIHAHKKI